MWCLPVSSSIASDLSTRNVSNNIGVIALTDMSEHETYYLTSPHLKQVTDSTVAYYRAMSLCMLFNVALKLTGNSNGLRPHNTIYFLQDDGRMFQPIIESNPMIELAEITNPFDIQEPVLKPVTKLDTILWLGVIDSQSRDVLTFLALAERDPLYLLVNLYKIIDHVEDSIKTDRDLQESEVISLKDFIDTRININPKSGKKGGSIRHYMNAMQGSGLLSRHGKSEKTKYDIEEIGVPTYNEILIAFADLTLLWLNVRLVVMKRNEPI